MEGMETISSNWGDSSTSSSQRAFATPMECPLFSSKSQSSSMAQKPQFQENAGGDSGPDSGDLMVELKSNEQAKKLGAIMTFLDIPVTVTLHKSLNSYDGVIRLLWGLHKCRLGEDQLPPRVTLCFFSRVGPLKARRPRYLRSSRLKMT
ncbi:hypothetical protein PoB_002723900 [Plakobranchus ocellatus]|uniref:Uncharacterized protein n=1 Tax=Plakobranchus ocellatus TaxID=259542 RepID=A0AAV4A3G3_9GAST|nr:hypothetical protein PoB_002723900 [Plakobranchus ocellatus]